MHLHDSNSRIVEITVSEARALEFDTARAGSNAGDDLATALDEVQQYVFSGDEPAAYLVIKVVPNP